jgi:hypothetical protein
LSQQRLGQGNNGGSETGKTTFRSHFDRKEK